MDTLLNNALIDFLWVYSSPWVIFWLILELLLLFFLYIWYKKYKDTSFMVFFEMIFEKVFDFFEDILWKEEKRWTKIYVTVLFFIILLSNLLGVILSFSSKFFAWTKIWEFLYSWITIPTADINFNIAMAVVWVSIVIYEQFKFLWFWKAMYEYVPFLWKWFIPYERWRLNKFIDWPLFILVKLFDIIISLFLGILEIIGQFAKIISLSFRLFWNVTSWWILLGMLFVAMIWFTGFVENLTWVEGDWFPIWLPVLVYLQEILVALIQALVFPLLIAIFIKVAKVH